MRKKPEEELHSKGNPSSFGSHQIVGVTNFKDGQGGGRIRLNINVKFNNIQNSNITETHKSSSNTKHICVSLPLWRFQLTLYRSLPQLGVRHASSQPGTSLLLVTLLHGQIQASGLTYTTSPLREEWCCPFGYILWLAAHRKRGERRSEQERQRKRDREERENRKTGSPVSRHAVTWSSVS